MNRTNTNSPPDISGGTRSLRLPEVGDRLRLDDVGKWDTTCRRDELQMQGGQLVVPLSRDEDRWLAPTSWATGQLCARLGIPASYFRKCPAFLQDEQVNHWLKNPRAVAAPPDEQDDADASSDGNTAASRSRCSQPNAEAERWRLRAREGTLRAVVSDRYSPLDNSTLFEQLRKEVPSRYRVDWFGLSSESLHLRLVDLERCREVLPGDDLSIGIHVANSEVGGRALSVEALIYRLVCTNGLIRRVGGRSLLRQRHIHISTLRLQAALAEATHRALEEAEGFLELLKAATHTPVVDVEAAIEGLGSRWLLSQSTQEAVKAALAREVPSQQHTLYGLVNAFTYTAQKLPDDARYDLEVLAGHLAEQGLKGLKLPSSKRTPLALPPAELSAVEVAREMFGAEEVKR